MRCPKCSRNMFSAKWKTCTAQGCTLNPLTVTRNAPSVTRTTEPSRRKEGPRAAVAATVVVDRPSPKTSAERQKEYRARKKVSA